MKIRAYSWMAAAALVASALGAWGQDAKTLRAQAETETNQEKQVLLLCKAADLEPKNKDFRKDCNDRKASMISSDRQALKTAQDAADANQPDKAKRYAKYVSSLDSDLHQQAQQLIAKLSAPATPAPQPVKADQSGVLLGQAQGAFDAGNLAAAKTAAEGVTDPNIKGTASHLLSQIDSYRDFVSAGKRQEDAKDFAQAVSSYQSALVINSHVSADDLNGRIQHLRQEIATAAQPPPVAPVQPQVQAQPKTPVAHPTPEAPKPVELSPEEKKKKLNDAYAVAMGRKDLDGAERSLKQIVQLDPHDAEASSRLKSVQEQLLAIINRDPVKLEKTLHDAVAAFYASNFEDAESELNRYIGADSAKKKGLAYFYLGATEEARALLSPDTKRTSRKAQAREYFRQARSAGYRPMEKYVSEKILEAWQQAGV